MQYFSKPALNFKKRTRPEKDSATRLVITKPLLDGIDPFLRISIWLNVKYVLEILQ